MVGAGLEFEMEIGTRVGRARVCFGSHGRFLLLWVIPGEYHLCPWTERENDVSSETENHSWTRKVVQNNLQ